MSARHDPSLAAVERVEIEDLRRAELIEAAIRVIASSGVDAASVRNIASAAGTSVSSVHYYFKSKEDLLSAAFRHHDEAFFAAISSQIAGCESARERLMTLTLVSFPEDDSANVEWSLIMAVMQLSNRHPALMAVHDTAHNKWLGLVRDALAEGLGSGEFQTDTPEDQLALEFAALFNGLGFYYQSAQVASTAAKKVIDDYISARLSPRRR